MKLLVFLTIWLDDLALLLGMIFTTNLTNYKIWVVFVIIMDIVCTFILGYFFKKDKKRVAKIMKSVILETRDNKLIIEGNKKEIITFLDNASFAANKINANKIKLVIDKEDK